VSLNMVFRYFELFTYISETTPNNYCKKSTISNCFLYFTYLLASLIY